MIETFLIWKIANHYLYKIPFSNGASGAAAAKGGQAITCVFTADEDSNDFIIVSFHLIIQIFYEFIFTKKLVAKWKDI